MIARRLGLAAAATVLAIAGCQPLVSVGPSTTANSTGLSASPTSSVTPSPSAAPTPAQTPTPAEVTAAATLVDEFTADLVHGRYAAAWQLLAPYYQQLYGSLAHFTDSERIYFRRVAGLYRVVTNPDIGPITNWIPFETPSIDLGHAVLVEVIYPKITLYNQWNVYIVAPTAEGIRLYQVR